MTDGSYRYQELADFITRLVSGGALLPGSRVPSLREISRERGTSLATALQAYRLLEDRGVLEARPQSGYYVARAGRAGFAAPAASRPPRAARSVAISGVVLQLLEHASDPGLVPLGCAIPSADLLAAGRLDRFLAHAARHRGIEYNTYTAPKGDPDLRLHRGADAGATGRDPTGRHGRHRVSHLLRAPPYDRDTEPQSAGAAHGPVPRRRPRRTGADPAGKDRKCVPLRLELQQPSRLHGTG